MTLRVTVRPAPRISRKRPVWSAKTQCNTFSARGNMRYMQIIQFAASFRGFGNVVACKRLQAGCHFGRTTMQSFE